MARLSNKVNCKVLSRIKYELKMKTTDGKSGFHQMTLTVSNESKKNNLFARFFKAEFRGGNWVENSPVKKIPKMAGTAMGIEFKEKFRNPFRKTKTYGETCEHGLELQEKKVKSNDYDAGEGITKRERCIVEETESGNSTSDASLNFAGQNVEHYEISTYGSLAQLARILDQYDVVELLEVPLDGDYKA